MIFLTVVLAFLLDIVLGEPKKFHPLVGYGAIASAVEKRLNRSTSSSVIRQILGITSWMTLVIVPTVLILLLITWSSSYFYSLGNYIWLIDAIVLYLAIAYKSLKQHTVAIIKPLAAGNLVDARAQLAMIVSRDTQTLDEQEVRNATIESVLENGSDAIFAPVFWYVVGGLPAVIVYRLANTLDAMWGYKTERFLWFGRFSARMDDILNYLPSRLVGFSYALLGKMRQGLRCWREQAHLLESPNGGVVMSAGAGALGIQLGGDGIYHGELKHKPVFGCGMPAQEKHMTQALRLVSRTAMLWCGLIGLGSLVYFIHSVM